MTEPQREITAEDMDAHVRAGRAQRWTRSLGGAVPDAVKMNNDWYVRELGREDYIPASPRLAALFDDADARLSLADEAVAKADVRAGG
ncbi:hypothetical protein [Amycolatopsis anabasis]|uniref:hypothetical protein n=1 Tax=Amycolatopsis anabasis TaxID=1840409 RepID=UPI00131E6499|nr:hypothetical protein [Amycolatopsis anabasis]